MELDSQHAQKVAELEQAVQQKLLERQKVYEEAFNQDMKQYLSTGYLQHRGKSLFCDIKLYFLLLLASELSSKLKLRYMLIILTRFKILYKISLALVQTGLFFCYNSFCLRV